MRRWKKPRVVQKYSAVTQVVEVMNEANQEPVTITLNGEQRGVPAGLTIRDLLAHLNLHERLVVVERNKEIVRRNEYGEVPVTAGDMIELVHFVGGG